MSKEAANLQVEAGLYIPLSAVTEGLRAVSAALNLPDEDTNTLLGIITGNHKTPTDDASWKDWLQAAKSLTFDDQNQVHLTNLAIALGALRILQREEVNPSPKILDQIWTLIGEALQCARFNWETVQHADGSLAIPLSTFDEDDHVREIIELRVWLPDVTRVGSEPVTHQRWSWVLAGQGSYRSLDVVGSTSNVEVYKRNMSIYTPDTNSFRIKVDPGALHATITSYDPRVLESELHGTSVDKRFARIGAAELASLFTDLRSWEDLQEAGLMFSDRGEWEDALREYRTALYKCKSNPWLNRPQYTHVTLRPIGKVFRMLGRYKDACEALEETVNDTPLSPFRVDGAGELAMIYRHLDLLPQAKRYAEEQYESAKQLGLEKFACRAIGNVGRVNYQLYLENKDPALLGLAIDQLNERVERAKRFGDIVLEAIGYSCLSLCFIEKGEYEDAVRIAQKNYDLTIKQSDASKVGFSKAFLGRALLLAGQKERAQEVFNEPGGCSPIIALCREISGEHRQYIKEMIAAGADLKLRDEQGYSALECAVYNGDEDTTKIIEDGLRAQIEREGGDIEKELNQYRYEAGLRKGYRDIFQDKLRPVLLGGKKDSALRELRDVYAASLAGDHHKQKTFDGLKYVPYAKFLHRKRLPKSSDKDTYEYSDKTRDLKNPFVIFFSYRWITKDHLAKTTDFSPDDPARTQYNRMLRAIDLFLELHSEIDRDELCIWIDFACVNQSDQAHQKPGVAALPMNLSQCDAMISLVDDQYYDRSWCCVEVLMIQTLKRAYGVHLWYEHVIEDGKPEGFLRNGPLDKEIDMGHKQVTLESDRPKLLFLERQTRLLG